MSDAVSVVISVAGRGTRLGMNVPKALVPVDGVPILARQLAALDGKDVIVVAGYRAQNVIELLREVRPTVPVMLNHDFNTTGTAASVSRGATLAQEWVVSLDGDLLVEPSDLHRVIEHPGRCLGIQPARSAAPVYAQLDGDQVVGLSQQVSTPWEWTGLVKLEAEHARALGDGHVFAGLLAHLPMPALHIDSVEVDDLDDLAEAEVWVRSRVSAP